MASLFLMQTSFLGLSFKANSRNLSNCVISQNVIFFACHSIKPLDIGSEDTVASSRSSSVETESVEC